MLKNVTIGMAVAALAFPSAGAFAQRGVHVDPDSPAGTEYAVPLEQARGQAGGVPSSPRDAKGSSQHGANLPLFGVGVSGSGRSSGEGKAGGVPSAQAGSQSRQSSDGQPETGPPVSPAATKGSSDSGRLTTALLVAAIIAAGGLGGLGLRRLRA